MRCSRLVTCLLVIVLVLLAVTSRMGAMAISAGSEPSAPIAQGQRLGQAGRIVLRADDLPSALRVPRRPRPAGLASQTATITVHYLQGVYRDGDLCQVWDPAARSAFQYAVDIWAEQLQSAVPIEVEACWTNLGAGVLGSAGPADFWRDFAGAPRGSTWYPIALANALAGTDLDGGDPEIEVSLNSAFSVWYLGTDGNPEPGKYDLVSVAVHELCHGLGFIGSMWVDAYGIGSWGWGSPYPIAFDHYLENGYGQSLMAFSNNSYALADQLRGRGNGGVYFDGPNAGGANGGPVKLYAPYFWDGGSSIYHVDGIFDGTPDALMTYSLSSGEAVHDPGPVTRGIMEDIGWTVAPPQPDLAITNRVVGSPDLAPGDPVTYALSIANTGAVTATSVVITDILPAEILAPTWDESPSLSALVLRGGTSYVWDLPTLAPGASGVISIAGTISPSLPADLAIWNTATIACVEPEALHNNTGVALVGGHRAFLPLVLKNSQ
jgi:uncharacterized repeat protein (TIGR01451 family)